MSESGVRMHTARLGYWVIAATAALSCVGCTIVRIDQQGTSTTVTRRFGVVVIEPGSRNSVVSVTSLGVHSAFGVLSVGFGHTEAATLDPATCQLILWRPTPAAVLTLRDLIGTQDKICMTDGFTSNNKEASP